MRLAALLAMLLPLAMIRNARGLRCCSFIKYSRNTQRVPTARFAELANGQDYVAALAYDFETSSADPSSTEAVQLAVVCANSRHPEPPTFLRYVLPSGDIEDGALGVHGISKEFLVSSGARPFEEVYVELKEWVNETFGAERPIVWTAHNGARFDEPILRRLAKEADGRSLPQHWRFHDTLPFAQGVVEGGKRKWGRGAFTLGRLYSDATGGKSLEGAHDALVDCGALVTVWKFLVAEQEKMARVSRSSSGGGGGGRSPQAAKLAASSSAEREQQQDHGDPSYFQKHLQHVGYGPVNTQQGAPGPRCARKSTSTTTTSIAAKAAVSFESVELHGPLSALPGVGPTVEAKLVAAQAWTTIDLAVGHYKGEFAGDEVAFKQFVYRELVGRRSGHPPPLSMVPARTAAKRIAEFCMSHSLEA